MSHYQKLVTEIIGKIETQRSNYGSVLVKSAIVRQDEIWENVVTRILPLYKSDSYTLGDKLDYGDFILFEELISLDDLVEIVKKLPEKGTVKISLGKYVVQVKGEGLRNGYKYDSGEDFLSIGWFFEKYYLAGRATGRPKEPMVSKDLPFFPDLRDAIIDYIGIDMNRYSDVYGITICLPRYGARIEEVNLGSKEIRLRIQPRGLGIENLLGKLYCKRGSETKHIDIDFEGETGIGYVGFMPDSLHVALVSKLNNELLDSRRYYSSWESPPKGVIIDIPEYGIKELIRQGESETVEFKEKISRPEKIAETAAAFANKRGGVILIGVNDSSEVVGLDEGKHGDTITNILRNHCNPQIEYKISKKQLEAKDIFLIHVEEGEDKPYSVKERGFYIRAHATNRIMTRQEMDEIYKQKQQRYPSAY